MEIYDPLHLWNIRLICYGLNTNYMVTFNVIWYANLIFGQWIMPEESKKLLYYLQLQIKSCIEYSSHL